MKNLVANPDQISRKLELLGAQFSVGIQLGDHNTRRNQSIYWQSDQARSKPHHSLEGDPKPHKCEDWSALCPRCLGLQNGFGDLIPGKGFFALAGQRGILNILPGYEEESPAFMPFDLACHRTEAVKGDAARLWLDFDNEALSAFLGN